MEEHACSVDEWCDETHTRLFIVFRKITVVGGWVGGCIGMFFADRLGVRGGLVDENQQI